MCRAIRVRKILRSDDTDFTYEREWQALPRIRAWKTEIERFLTANEGRPSRERLTLIRVYEEVRRSATMAATTASRRTPMIRTLLPLACSLLGISSYCQSLQ